MKLYKKYNLNDDVGFLNVELTTDNAKWIDPMMMHMDKSQMGMECCEIVQDFFSKLLEIAISKNDNLGYKYTQHFSEMNETRIGYSQNKPNGLSGGENLGREIYTLIRKSNAIRTGMIGDIFDASVMIENLGPDKISDFITSLIFEKLINYTQNECLKYNIPLKTVTIKNGFWSHDMKKWIHDVKVELPFDEESNMAIVFVPKNFTEGKVIYSYKRFYNKAMLPYLGKVAVENKLDGLIKILKDKTRKPLYKNIRKKYPCTRENVSNFIMEHEDVYNGYKEKQLKYIGYKNYK